MPWKETCPMEERVRFVVLANEKRAAMAQLCRSFGISRETGYKWLARHQESGVAGLRDMPRRPHSNKRSFSQTIVDATIALRRKYPLWGPKKLAILLKEQLPEVQIPAVSTIGDILKRNGLVKPMRRRRFRIPNEKPDLTISQSNDVWCTDFKGHFLVGDGQRCHPLTLTDAYSRYLLICDSSKSESVSSVWPLYEAAFERYGLPKIILSDNGSPFASRAPGGLTRLSAWWVKLGITPIHIQPSHPEQNGRHERMHRTLKAATARPPASSLFAQQQAFDAFKDEYNHYRPHEAIGQMRPGQLYVPSLRAFSQKIAEPCYPSDCEVRQVRQNGEIKWKGHLIYLSEVFTGEQIALKEVGDDLQLIYFYHVPVAWLDERKNKTIILPSQLKKLKVSGMSPV